MDLKLDLAIDLCEQAVAALEEAVDCEPDAAVLHENLQAARDQLRDMNTRRNIGRLPIPREDDQ
jgi:hypothetical protein